MGFLEGALLLAWVAIVLMAFAISGILRQIQILREQAPNLSTHVGLRPGIPAPSIDGNDVPDGTPQFVLFTAPDCRSCEKVLPALGKIAADRLSRWDILVVMRSAGEVTFASPRISVLTNPAAFSEYRIPLVPMAVAIDGNHRVLSTEAVGSAMRLEAFIDRLQDNGAKGDGP